MKPVNSIQFIENLQSDTRQLILTANFLSTADPEILLTPPEPGKWSVVQILEHMNSYGRYYLPALEKALRADKLATKGFKTGWLGNYFTKIMKPGGDGIVTNRMKSPKDHSPADGLDIKPVMDDFLQQQQTLLELLELAKAKNINAIRVPVSISKFIKLKAGDTFGFFVAHQQRHFVQIVNTIEALKDKDVTGKFQVVRRVA